MASITLLAGCGTATVVDEPAPAPRPVSAHATLIGRVSKALDEAFTAEYERSDGTVVTVWAAEDGTWRVDVPGWGHGGAVDVSVAWTTGGFFQCADEQCVKLAGITGQIPSEFDPEVQRPFVEWLPQLLDRHLPFAVSQEGDCFTLTRNTVVVQAPIPAGEWCLDGSGTILSVTIGDVGSLTLLGDPEPAVATVELPGEVADAEPVGRKAPEPPEETPSPGASTSPSPSVTPSPSPDGSDDE
ncbi:hypothetical protein [Glycomyces tarimensis]